MKELSVKETQQISYEILKKVADICEKIGIRYCLIYGTLIGAIRHKGFIPWDDDLDIMMPRPDYERFLIYFKEHQSEFHHLELFNRKENANYPYMISRISDSRYQIEMDNEEPYGMGVFIDIYPFDGLGNTKAEAIKYGMKGDRLSSLCYQATRAHFSIENTTSFFRKLIKFPVYKISKCIGKDYFQTKLMKLENIKNYDSSKYVGCVTWLSGGEKDIFPREWFDETILWPFEDSLFRIPKHYDQILKHIYENYMQLPPKEEQIGHHFYRVYKTQ